MTRDREFGPRARRYRWRVALADRDPRHRRRSEELIGEQPGLDLVWSGSTAGELAAWLAEAAPSEHPVLLVTDALLAQQQDGVLAGLRVLVGPDDELIAAIWSELSRGRRIGLDQLGLGAEARPLRTGVVRSREVTPEGGSSGAGKGFSDHRT